MNRISPKRKATAKLAYNSTFAAKALKKEKKVYTIAEMKAAGLLQKASTLGKGKTDRAKWKAKADKEFSRYIRLRDSDEFGIATCVTSGKRMKWRMGDCGHWISRGKEATRYHEWNAHFQGKQANRFQGGHFLEHGLAIDRIHGRDARQWLETLAGTTCKRSADDYKRIAELFKAKADELLRQFPGKA